MKDILDKLREMGYRPPGDELYARVVFWESWYAGTETRFHNYRVFNGQKHVPCRRSSLSMAKRVCEDWADLLLNEKAAIRAAGEKEQVFLDRVLRENAFPMLANALQERKAALGTVAYVPRYVAGGDGKGSLRIDGVDARGIIPLSWENGRVMECAFASRRCRGDENFVVLQIHHLSADGTYVLENRLFLSENGVLAEAPLAALPDCASVPPLVRTGRRTPQFVLDRMNLADNRDPDSPLGISVFANAIDQLRGVDVAYDSYVNEFILGKKRILVKPEATKDFDGQPLFDTDELAFYILPEDSGNDSVIREIDMSLRTSEHREGIRDMLGLLASACGLGGQYYTLERTGVKTATQVVSENSALYRSVRRQEIPLRQALEELARVLLRMGNDYEGLGLDEETGITIDLDDSVIEDTGTAFEREARMLELGVLSAEEFRSRWARDRRQ